MVGDHFKYLFQEYFCLLISKHLSVIIAATSHVAARFSGKLEKRRPNKQPSAESNVRFTKTYLGNVLPSPQYAHLLVFA